MIVDEAYGRANEIIARRDHSSNQQIMMRRYNRLMRAVVAVIVRVSVQCMRDGLGEVLRLTMRNVRIERIIELFQLNDRDESRRSWSAIEAEHRSLVEAAGLHRSFGGVCVF